MLGFSFSPTQKIPGFYLRKLKWYNTRNGINVGVKEISKFVPTERKNTVKQLEKINGGYKM